MESLAAVSAASHITSFHFLIYKMWIITYLTGVYEKLFEGPCLSTGFIVLVFNVDPPPPFFIDIFDTDRMSILILGKSYVVRI